MPVPPDRLSAAARTAADERPRRTDGRTGGKEKEDAPGRADSRPAGCILSVVSPGREAGSCPVLYVVALGGFHLFLKVGDACLDEVWTFFPDPWRKARHRKRRLVSGEFALQVARVLRDGGVWRLATDWDDYAWQMRDVIEGCPLFENPYVGQRPDPEDPEAERGGFAPRYEGRVVTHFETRGIDAGRRVHDIVGVRLPRESA